MRSVISIGTFDGCHIGHQALIRRAREIAKANPGSRVVAMAFDPNPLEILRPAQAPARLTTFATRSRHLVEAGADEVVRLEPTPEFLGLSPREFLDRCIERHHPIAFVEGEDFRFGRGRAGTVQTLRDLGSAMGFSVDVVQGVEVALGDHQIVPARSTMVRWLLGHGRVRDAAILLGRAYELEGTVVRGDRRGRTIGYPTANLETVCMAPADGVYACRATLPDGRVFSAAVSVGKKPTFGEHARAVEAFILNPGGAGKRWAPIDGLSEYGWPLRLEFVAWVREQVKYGSLQDLLDQIARDCDRVDEIVKRDALGDALTLPAFDHRAESKEAFA